MRENELNSLLKDMSYYSEFKILEEGKDADEIKKVAKKRGIVWPSPDLAFFKARYGYVDRTNLNGCSLPKEEIQKALGTLTGKAVDFDHFRKRIVGTFLEAKLEGDEIIAYGTFYKDNLKEEYEDVKDLMDKGNLGISFEAYGTREYNEDGKTYNLVDILLTGGGLLLKSDPAFVGAGVLEMSKKKERVLEFAKVMTEPETYVHFSDEDEGAKDPKAKVRNRGDVVFPAGSSKVNDDKDHFPINNIAQARNALARVAQYDSVPPWFDGTLKELVEKVKSAVKNKYPSIEVSEVIEQSRYYLWDADKIYQAISEVENLDGENKGLFEILAIDFVKNQVKVKDIPTEGEMLIDLTPKAVVTKKGKIQVSKIEDLTAVGNIEDMDKYIQGFKGSDEELEILIEKASDGPRISYTDRLDLTDEDFAVVKQMNTENINKKIRLFPIPDLATINNVKDRLEQTQVKATLDKLGITIDNVERKITRRKKEIAMKQLIEKIQKSSVEEVLKELAKATLERELTEVEFEKAYSLVVLKEPKGDANDTSLLKVPGRKSSANETSLINAEITEDTLKAAITEAVKDTEEAKKLAEKEALAKAETEKAAKEKEEADKKIKEEAEAKAKKEQEEAEARQKAIATAETEKDKQIATLTDELAKANKKIEEFDKAMKDKTISERKEKLGEFAKDMKDEDILDETKFVIAMKDKEIAELKANKKPTEPDLIKGSKGKESLTPEAETRKMVDAYAWGELKDK